MAALRDEVGRGGGPDGLGVGIEDFDDAAGGVGSFLDSEAGRELASSRILFRFLPIVPGQK